jgi:septal ring factor EnvC (AmiA/AmiB activator)
MARTKSLESIEAEIARTEDELEKLQTRYDKVMTKLEQLQNQKREYETKQIMEAYLKSGKSFDEIMTFLTP